MAHLKQNVSVSQHASLTHINRNFVVIAALLQSPPQPLIRGTSNVPIWPCCSCLVDKRGVWCACDLLTHSDTSFQWQPALLSPHQEDALHLLPALGLRHHHLLGHHQCHTYAQWLVAYPTSSVPLDLLLLQSCSKFSISYPRLFSSSASHASAPMLLSWGHAQQLAALAVEGVHTNPQSSGSPCLASRNTRSCFLGQGHSLWMLCNVTCEKKLYC